MGGSFRGAWWPSLRKDAGGASDGTTVKHERSAARRITPIDRIMSNEPLGSLANDFSVGLRYLYRLVDHTSVR
jgi:hypothetical protein